MLRTILLGTKRVNLEKSPRSKKAPVHVVTEDGKEIMRTISPGCGRVNCFSAHKKAPAIASHRGSQKKGNFHERRGEYPTAGGVSTDRKGLQAAPFSPGVCSGRQGRKSVEQSHEPYTRLICTLIVKWV